MSKSLNQKIQHFYDSSSALWETAWGEHMHHGYYGDNGVFPRNHYQAQIDMIEKILEWVYDLLERQIESPIRHIIDIGCGIGGSAAYLAKRLNAEVTGITLSPVQAKRAHERSGGDGNGELTWYLVADALFPPFKSGSFDLVWSLESAEHIPDKQGFLTHSVELLKPGGHFLMATWCHRPTSPALTSAEKEYLNWLYKAYNLPGIISISEYAEIAEGAGLTNVAVADWSKAVQPFWPAVIRSALIPRNIIALFQSGWNVMRGALTMPLMAHGYRSGLIRFGLLKGTKE